VFLIFNIGNDESTKYHNTIKEITVLSHKTFLFFHSIYRYQRVHQSVAFYHHANNNVIFTNKKIYSPTLILFFLGAFGKTGGILFDKTFERRQLVCHYFFFCLPG